MNAAELKTLKDHVCAYELAKLNLDIVQETAKNIEEDVLNKNFFYIDPTMKEIMEYRGVALNDRITRADDACMIREEQKQLFYELCYVGYKKAGIADRRGVGYCPDNEARETLYTAESEMINYAIQILPQNYNGFVFDKGELRKGIRNIIYKEKFINLIMMMAKNM